MTDVYCDCTGPPWPSMLRLHASGTLARFYLCQRCGVIREDKTRTDGTRPFMDGLLPIQFSKTEVPAKGELTNLTKSLFRVNHQALQ